MGKLLKKVCFVFLLTTFSSAYAGGCFDEVSDVDDCRVKAEQGDAEAQSEFARQLTIYGHYKQAAKWYRKAAEQGDAEAQSEFARQLTIYGHYKQAAKWYRKAAEQGDAEAQYNLGVAYGNGEGVPQHYKQAVKWFRKAAEQGHAVAQFLLGGMYYSGQGVIQDDVMAHMYWGVAAVGGDENYEFARQLTIYRHYKWYRKAAEQGNSGAQYNLGASYADGQGALQDYKQAVKWFRKAAEQGNVDAQFLLGGMYYSGQGVIQDDVMAHMYWNVAAVSGDKNAAKNRGFIAKRMSPSQLAEAQKLAREWMRNH